MTTLPHSNGERQKLRYFDTFTGIGGFTVALSELGHDCIGFSEIDRYASSVYQYHFPSHPNYGDITRITELPDFDILVGGFPCQAFSVAGKRRGFADTRGTLFFDLARILQSKRPRFFVFENVKGLLSHDNGSTFKTIIATLDELGYGYQWQVLNSKHFGVPQNRERVFIVGHLGGTPRPEVFPIGEGKGEPATAHAGQVCIGRWVNKQSGVVEDDTAPTLRSSGGTDIRKIPVVIDHGAIRETEDRAQCITASYWKGLDNHGARTAILTYDMKSAGSSTRRGALSDSGVAKTLDHDCAQAIILAQNQRREVRTMDVAGTLPTTQSRSQFQVVAEGATIRRLTPIECERLQGFPDNWTAMGTEGPISDTQRYKMCGNAVTVNVVREIVNKLTP